MSWADWLVNEQSRHASVGGFYNKPQKQHKKIDDSQ